MALSDEMSSERWRQIERVFFAALDCSATDLDAFVQDACGGDAELCAEVTDLLKASDQAHGFLEALDAAQAAALLDEAARPEGRHVGPYVVVREVGRGGMGVVYLAERASRDERAQFEQQVALKLVKRGMDSDAVLRRFLNERRILARLQHPNVARLLDGGVTDDGQPYFAMEYVDGTPITAYCDVRTLSVDARLRLFEDACRAVQYAHQHLVVHRDLKPSNILVTADGQVKLLDFGIARLLGPDDDAVGSTETGVRVMTPAYAAPEQVRGEPVTTATDIYTLGVVLYELLTGRRPYDAGHLGGAPVERAVLEAEPPLPSAAARRAGDVHEADGVTETLTAERVSAARGTSPERLRRRLAGDLDTIVLKALRMEPEWRYASVEAFVGDLRRHLAGQPVTARRNTLGYRARTFIRRHGGGVAAAALVFASLAGGLGAALWQAQEKARQAARAEEVQAFLISLFETSDPDVSKGETITARELLDDGAARIEKELAAQPGVQGELMHVMGEIYARLGLYDAAERLYRKVLAQFRTLHGLDHPDVARSLHALGTVLREKGDYDGAEVLLREALALRRRLLDRDHPDIATSLYDLGWTLRYKSDYEGAEQLFREALTLHRSQFGEEHEEVANSLYNLAWIRGDRGDYPEAERLHREVLALRRKLLGEENLAVAQSLSNLAGVLQYQGKYDESERFNREALAMRRKLLGDEHPDVATTMNTLGVLMLFKRDYVEAERLLRQVLAMYRARLGDTHPYVTTTLNNLATTLRDKGDYAAAIATYREAVALRRALLGEEDVDAVLYLWNLADALRRAGDYDESERLNREALMLRRKLLGDEHPHVIASLNTLGLVLREKGAYEEAEQHLQEAVALSRRVLGEEHLPTATSLHNLGSVLRATERYEEADTAYRAAMKGYRTLMGDEHPRILSLQYEMSLLLRDRGDTAAAERELRDLLAKQRALLGTDHPDVQQTERSLAALPDGR